MKFPTIRQQNNLTVSVPGFVSGLNVHDTLTAVEDTQLTAADNMWWHRAALRTRPGVCATGVTYAAEYTDRQWVSDREVLLTSCKYTSGSTVPFYAATLTQEGGFRKLGKNGQAYTAKAVDGKAPTAFGCYASKDATEDSDGQADYLYFLSSGEIIKENCGESSDGWVTAEPYVPTVAINGNAYQEMNMLTGQFKCTFRPDGNATFFKMPVTEMTYNDGEKTTVSFSLKNPGNSEIKEYTFELTKDDIQTFPDGAVYAAKSVDIDKEYIRSYNLDSISGQGVTLQFNFTNGNMNLYIRYTDTSITDGNNYVQTALPAMSKETITVTAWKTEESRRLKICKMTQCTWFGNSRLFVCGHPDEKNLIYWSDVNNPLYFPENNHVYVGDYSQRVTAMRRQGEMLAVFQEHNLHGMVYVLGDEDDYEYAKSVGLYATSVSMKVSLVSIHPGIGCDCPDSIRLVNNRLVWATSKGKVYMLPTVNQYNERNVREISRNIFPLLSQHGKDALVQSFSGEYYGYYTLLVGNRMYLLDSQTSAFSSFNYYSKEENAQKALPWYVWTLPQSNFFCMLANDTVMHLAATVDGVGRVYALEGNTDDGAPIDCSFTTKIFDFDRPDCKKAINQMYVGIGDSPESTVDISYITEHGEAVDAWQMESRGDYDEREPGYMVQHRLTPNVSRVRMFGFRLHSTGAIAVGSILLKFKTQGVVR